MFSRAVPMHGGTRINSPSCSHWVKFQLIFHPLLRSAVVIRLRHLCSIFLWPSEPHTNDERGGLKVNLTLMEYSNLWPSCLLAFLPSRLSLPRIAPERARELAPPSHCKLELRSLFLSPPLPLSRSLPLPRGLSRELRACCMVRAGSGWPRVRPHLCPSKLS